MTVRKDATRFVMVTSRYQSVSLVMKSFSLACHIIVLPPTWLKPVSGDTISSIIDPITPVVTSITESSTMSGL